MSRIPLSGIRRMVRLSGVKINSMHNSHLHENLAWILLLTCQRATFSAPRMNVAMQARKSDNSHRLSFSRWFLVFGAGLAQRKTKNQRPNGCGPEGSRTPCLLVANEAFNQVNFGPPTCHVWRGLPQNPQKNFLPCQFILSSTFPKLHNLLNWLPAILFSQSLML